MSLVAEIFLWSRDLGDVEPLWKGLGGGLWVIGLSNIVASQTFLQKVVVSQAIMNYQQ